MPKKPETVEVEISTIKVNTDNPRYIKDQKFLQLVKSIKEFPEMLWLRPVVLNKDMIILGGNMRLRAAVEAGLTKVPALIAKDLTEDQQEEFIIKDNVSFGDWDWDKLANEWDENKLEDWGLTMNWNEKQLLNVDAAGTHSQPSTEPKKTDDEYSTFELVMLHENKLLLIQTLNEIKNKKKYEKLEEALIELITFYKSK